jgi:hypothetical protein
MILNRRRFPDSPPKVTDLMRLYAGQPRLVRQDQAAFFSGVGRYYPSIDMPKIGYFDLIQAYAEMKAVPQIRSLPASAALSHDC